MLQEGRIDYHVSILIELALHREICFEAFLLFVGFFYGELAYFFHSLLVESLYLYFLWLRRRVYICYMWRKAL